MVEIIGSIYPDPGDDQARGDASNQAEGSSERFRLRFGGAASLAESATEGPIEISFYAYEKIFVRLELIPQQATKADAVAAIAAVMARPDWREAEWKSASDPKAGQAESLAAVPPAPVVPEVVAEATKPWPASTMTGMRYIEPAVARAIEISKRRHVTNPFFPHEGE